MRHGRRFSMLKHQLNQAKMTNTSQQPTPQAPQSQLDETEAARLQLEATKVIGCGIVVMTLGALCAMTIIMLAFLFMLMKFSDDRHETPPPVFAPYR